MHMDYTGQGFDQLLDVIDKIKNKPDDRRIILSAWNPCDLKLMALPPCHMFAQVGFASINDSFIFSNSTLICKNVRLEKVTAKHSKLMENKKTRERKMGTIFKLCYFCLFK